MRRMQLEQLEAGLHRAPRGISVVLHKPRDFLAREFDGYALAGSPSNGGRSHYGGFRHHPLRTAMSELQPRYCTFGSDGFRNVGKARDHPIVVCAELGVESTTPAIVSERNFYDHKSCAARRAGSVVFNILPRCTSAPGPFGFENARRESACRGREPKSEQALP